MREVDVKTGKGVSTGGLALDAEAFELLRRQITTASGIYIPADDNARFVIEHRLMPRLRARGSPSFSEYVGSLDGDELELMLDAVAIHETYFFRERRQLTVFSDNILPELEKARRPIKIWSAGCSTGEEAYTIGMLLAERDLLRDGRSQVIASDLSRRVIEIGKSGIYGSHSFRTTHDSFKEKYFTVTDADCRQSSEELRRLIRFEQLNLMHLDGCITPASGHTGGGYDVIFCRNVLMYFDTEAVSKVLDSFYSLLNEGGFLLLGHAESLLPMGTSFIPVQYGREYVHKK